METSNIDISKITKRLQLIKTLISLEEEDEIDLHIAKLQEYVLLIDIKNIVECLKNKLYSKAVIAIETFIDKHNSITVYVDPEIEALRLEIKSLETEFNHLSDEKADLEKLIHQFGIRHNDELGNLLLKILQHRMEKAKGTPKQKETEEDYKNYEKQFEATKKEKVVSLTDEEQKELKDKYRKASKLCHPDVVSDGQKEFATKLFSELSSAYEKNDLEKVKEILSNLEKGNFFVNKSDTITEKQLLLSEIEKLRLKVKELKEEIDFISSSDTYKSIVSINNWDQYFEDAKKALQLQLKQFGNAE